MEELSKKFTPIYFLCIIIMILMFYILFNGSVANSNVDYLKEKIESIENNVDVIYKDNKKIDKKIDAFKISIEKIDKSIIINNTKIDKLKQYEKDKQNSFLSYDARMWERYFSDRYKNKK